MVPNKSVKMLSDIQGSGFDASTDSLESIKNNLGGLKAVQRGLLTLSGASDDVTITAVVMAKAKLDFSFYYDAASDDVSDGLSGGSVRGQLTTTTNIEFARGGVQGTAYIAWEVVEWN